MSMNEGKCCGTCKFHFYDRDDEDWVCDNLESECYMDFTGYEDSCEEFEARHPKKLSEKLTSELDQRTRAFQNYGR